MRDQFDRHSRHCPVPATRAWTQRRVTADQQGYRFLLCSRTQLFPQRLAQDRRGYQSLSDIGQGLPPLPDDSLTSSTLEKRNQSMLSEFVPFWVPRRWDFVELFSDFRPLINAGCYCDDGSHLSAQ